MGRRYRNGWWLEQKYWVEELTQAEIAEECGGSARCIRKWMQKRGIETHDLVGENHPQHDCERDELCQNCDDDGSNRRLDVHHIVPFRLFDQADDVPKSAAHDPGNLVLLCRPCHRKTERDEVEFHSSLEPPE